MVLPIIGAAVGAGLSMASSAAQTNAQNDAIRAKNQAAVNNYKTQLQIRDDQWKRTSGIYANRVGTYHSQLKQNEIAASKAYASQQTRLNNLYKQYAFGLFDAQIKAVASGGQAAAAGKQGRSAERLNRAAERVFVRQRGKGLATLRSGDEAFQTATRDIRDSLTIQNRNAWTAVSTPPMPPRALEPPVQSPGVNSTVAGLSMLSAGISGAQQGFSFGTGLDTFFNG